MTICCSRFGERIPAATSVPCAPMRTAVSSIRRKLGDDADHPTYIFTEPRVGYWMARAGEADETAEA